MKNFTVEGHLLKAKASVLRGDFEEAFDFYRDVLDMSPENEEARTNIKAAEDAIILNASPDAAALQEILALQDSKNFPVLSERLSKLLEDHPKSIFLWNQAGRMHWTLRNWEGAERAFRRTTELSSHFAAGYNNLGAVLRQIGRLDEAIECFRRALEIKPGYADAHSSLGSALKARGDLDGAIESFSKAISSAPGFAAAHNNLGGAFLANGQKEDALKCFLRAAELDPNCAESHHNLGVIYRGLGEIENAIASFSQAIKLRPDYAEAYHNLGNAFADLGQMDRAIEHHSMATKLQPDHFRAYCSLGEIHHHLRRPAEALGSFRRALEINPDLEGAQAQILYQKRYICDWTPEPGISGSWETLCLEGQSVDPFIPLTMDDDPRRQMRRAVDWARKKFQHPPFPLPAKPKTRPGKLRIGYFSSDFAHHAVFFLISGLLREHDRDRFEIYAYSYGDMPAEKHRESLGDTVDAFIDIRNPSRRQVVDLIRSHDLHIALDLNGYTRFARSELFAYRLAPIQINYLGYPGTMGAGFMDYIVADEVLVPAEYRDGCSEKVIYLPDAYQPNDNTRTVPETGTSRSDFGLPENGFVFCCFNNLYKISPAEFDVWMRLLRQMEGSVLWLLAANEWAEANLRKEAVARGIDEGRIIFAGRVSPAEHLARHKHADLFLDTFNYNAHTTSSDALWCGLPVVTKIGRQFAARVAASLLTAVGLPELITTTEQEYERLILELATDPQRLAETKEKLARNRHTHPLFDTIRYTRHFEQAMDEVYDRYLRGEAPADVRIGGAPCPPGIQDGLSRG